MNSTRRKCLFMFMIVLSASMSAYSANTTDKAYLEVSRTILKANNRTNTFHVDVSSSGSWTAVPVANDDGTSFLSIYANGNQLDIRCPANPDCENRSQKVMVKMDDLFRIITVRQAGLGIEFFTDQDLVVFKADGGSKKVKVSCNNTRDEGEGGNWSLLSSPEWLDVLIDRSKVKVRDKDNILQPMKTLDITFICRRLVSPSAEAFTGRRGTVVLASGNQRRAVTIEQTGVEGTLRRFAFGADLEDVAEEDGMDLKNLPGDFKGGARVLSLSIGGAAKDLGIKTDDIIIEMDDKSVECVADFVNLLNMHHPDEMVYVKVIRNGNILSMAGVLRAVHKL